MTLDDAIMDTFNLIYGYLMIGMKVVGLQRGNLCHTLRFVGG